MADIKETVTRTEDSGVDERGAAVQQQTKEIHTEASTDAKATAGNAVWYIFGLFAIILIFRFVLKLFGANPASGFVDFVYAVSGILSAPFDNIFGVSSAQAGQVVSVFEPSILVAIAVYALIAWGAAKLININQRR